MLKSVFGRLKKFPYWRTLIGAAILCGVYSCFFNPYVGVAGFSFSIFLVILRCGGVGDEK